MRMDEFDYELPPDRIAQRPAEPRDASRLMMLTGDAGLSHHEFRELPRLLRPGDVLVFNDTRVLAARVRAHRATGGATELLFVRAGEEGANGPRWDALVRPAKRAKAGDVLDVAGTELRVVGVHLDGVRTIEFPAGLDVPEWLEAHGEMPLPPYIQAEPGDARRALDRDRYQTVYAREPGAVAAPTAGLHFTPELLAALQEAGVEVAYITLDVGPGTFRPVTVEDTADHRMDGERYRLPRSTVETVMRAKDDGRRVLAVGTTSVRTLEHAARSSGSQGSLQAGAGVADLFVTPGYRFRVVDGMITNLHLPRSTPILMVAALTGRDRLMAAYAEAIDKRYRFYSYGDAMLVERRPDRGTTWASRA